MPPERRYDGNIQDVHRIAACAAQPDVLWAQHHGGIYRSVDGGLHWTPIADARAQRLRLSRWRRTRRTRSAPGSRPRIRMRSACRWTAAWW